ncbi:hypothetical protein ACOSP7_021123 [Xanthoceras sorbifolium]
MVEDGIITIDHYVKSVEEVVIVLHFCYNRFDRTYQGFQGGNNQNYNAGNQTYNTGNQASFQQNNMTTLQGKGIPQQQANLLQSTAYYAIPETMCDQPWYADSGATNHVTSDLGNLSVQADYRGNDRLTVGNGQQLNISQIGTEIISTPLCANNLFLKDVLCVPMIARIC